MGIFTGMYIAHSNKQQMAKYHTRKPRPVTPDSILAVLAVIAGAATFILIAWLLSLVTTQSNILFIVIAAAASFLVGALVWALGDSQ